MTKQNSKSGIQSPPLNAHLSDSFPRDVANEKKVSPLKLSLSQLTTLRWSLADEVVQLKETGYDAIGLWRPKVIDFGEERSADLLRETGMRVSSLSFAGGFTGSCGFSYLEAIADGRQAIAQANQVGADNLIVIGGAQNGHTDRHSRRMVVDGLRALGDEAAKSRLKISLQSMHSYFRKRWTFLNSLDATLDLISQASHPHIKLAFDAYHLMDEPNIASRIPEIVDLTGIVQISDADRAPTSDQNRLMPGQGKIPLKEIIHGFQNAGYNGYFDIQVWSGRVWKSNYSHLIEQSHAEVKALSHRAIVST